MTPRRGLLFRSLGLLLVLTSLSLGGCLIAVLPEQAQSWIYITPSRADTLTRVRNAMAEFSAKYDYSVSTPWHYPPELAQTDYKARSGLFGHSEVIHAGDRPQFISVFRGLNDSIVVTYQGQADVRATNNPVVNDLKRAVVRYTRGERLGYKYEAAHWRVTGPGD